MFTFLIFEKLVNNEKLKKMRYRRNFFNQNRLITKIYLFFFKKYSLHTQAL